MLSLGVLAMDGQHLVLKDVGVAIGAQLGKLLRPLHQPGGHFDPPQLANHLVVAGFNSGRQDPDAKDHTGYDAQSAQRAGLGRITCPNIRSRDGLHWIYLAARSA